MCWVVCFEEGMDSLVKGSTELAREKMQGVESDRLIGRGIVGSILGRMAGCFGGARVLAGASR